MKIKKKVEKRCLNSRTISWAIRLWIWNKEKHRVGGGKN